MDQRPATVQAPNSLENRRFAHRAALAPLLELDRRTTKSWITVVVLALFVALVTACSGVDEGTESSQSGIAQAGRWKPSAAALSAGASVRVAYDEAPRWTGAGACGPGLKVGGKKLGTYLRDKFAVITSVGGFACRRNTADSSRMSVHGTGRALDIFIPRTGGAADNTQGDKVANWLVTNAQRVGVQLVIWDRTIWRANGTNDAAYSGPHPHDDHLHVELSNAAGAGTTPWFRDMSDGDDDDDGVTQTADAGTNDEDNGVAAADAGRADTSRDSGTPDSATNPPSSGQPDAGPPNDQPEEEEPPPVDPADDDHADDATPRGDTLPDEPSHGDPSDGIESADDEPGETDSLPSQPRGRRRSTAELEAPPAEGGCRAAPARNTSTSPLSGGGAALALAMGLVAWRRRKRSL